MSEILGFITTEKITVYEREDKRCITCKRIIAAGDRIVGEKITTPFYTTTHYLCTNSCYEQYRADLQLSQVFVEQMVRSHGSG